MTTKAISPDHRMIFIVLPLQLPVTGILSVQTRGRESLHDLPTLEVLQEGFAILDNHDAPSKIDRVKGEEREDQTSQDDRVIKSGIGNEWCVVKGRPETVQGLDVSEKEQSKPMKQGVDRKGHTTEDHPGEYGSTDVYTEKENGQQDEQIMETGDWGEPENHTQGEPQRNLAWISIRIHHPDEFDNVLNHLGLSRSERWLGPGGGGRSCKSLVLEDYFSRLCVFIHFGLFVIHFAVRHYCKGSNKRVSRRKSGPGV